MFVVCFKFTFPYDITTEQDQIDVTTAVWQCKRREKAEIGSGDKDVDSTHFETSCSAPNPTILTRLVGKVR